MKLYNQVDQFRRDSPVFKSLLDYVYLKPEEIKKLKEFNKFIKWKTESEPLKDYFEKLDSEEWTKEFECNIMLNTSTNIFCLFYDILLDRLNLIWLINIENKHILQQLISLVFDRISKINLYLSEFINSIILFLKKNTLEKELLTDIKLLRIFLIL